MLHEPRNKLGPGPLLAAILEYIPIGTNVTGDGYVPAGLVVMVDEEGVKPLQRPSGPLASIPFEEPTLRVIRRIGLDAPVAIPPALALRGNGVVRNEEWLLVTDEGPQFRVLCNGGPILDETGEARGAIIHWQDLVDHMETEERFRKALEAKDLALREMAHRNANNYQTILSLISLNKKKNFVDIEEFAHFLSTKITELSHVQALINSQDDGRSKALGPYVEGLCAAHRNGVHDISVVIEDDVFISLEQAQTLGMIINEVICNSMEHAFSDDEPGRVEVGARSDNGHLEISVADNGIGFGARQKPVGSLGLRLLEGLTDRLKGVSWFSKRTGGGTVFRLRFPSDGSHC